MEIRDSLSPIHPINPKALRWHLGEYGCEFLGLRGFRVWGFELCMSSSDSNGGVPTTRVQGIV